MKKKNNNKNKKLLSDQKPRGKLYSKIEKNNIIGKIQRKKIDNKLLAKNCHFNETKPE